MRVPAGTEEGQRTDVDNQDSGSREEGGGLWREG